MAQKYVFLSSVLIFLIQSLWAQPDEAYIKRLSGDVNQEWLKSKGETSPLQILEWSERSVHGFKKSTPLARKHAAFLQPWSFLQIGSNGKVIARDELKLPHRFARNREYNSGWYITKFRIDKVSDKNFILKLNRVEMFSMVYVNGKRLDHHFGAFTPFETDITDALMAGENSLAIFVYDQSASVDNGKLYNQVGITRLSSGSQGFRLPGGIHDVPVLEIRENAYIQDIFVKTSTRKGEMEIEYELASRSGHASKLSLSFELLKWPNGEKTDVKIPEINLTGITDGPKSFKVKWGNAELWSPDHPNLYVLRTTLKNGKNKDVLDTRFGFREFWVEGKMFMLNGSPIRLRGESHYHPMRYDVDFHREVFKMHKKLFGSNACRVHAFMPPGDIMLGADEAGMLIIDQSAVWSVNGQFYAKGGDWLLENLKKEYEEWARRDRNCPSVVIWDVENEMLRFNHKMHYPWVSKLPGFITKYDDTRPFNFSGGGWFSDEQQMVSLHMQERYTRIMSDWINKGSRPLIMGEFWVGGRSEQRLPNSPEFSSVKQRYIEEAKVYREKLFEMRYMGVSGIMPFRISLLSFPSEPHSSDKYEFVPPDKLNVATRSDEVIQILRHSLQPVTTFFWPRQTYAPQHSTFSRELVVCNDGETSGRFEISWQLGDEKIAAESIDLSPAQQKRLSVNLPAPLSTTPLIATLKKGDKIISSDTLMIQPFKPSLIEAAKPILVFKDEVLAEVLRGAGLNVVSSHRVPDASEQLIWLIPENANNRELFAKKDEIMTYLDEGGRLLCLKQNQAPTWFPVKMKFWSGNQASLHTYSKMGWEGINKYLFYSTVAPIYAPDHPIFKGINNSKLHLWDAFDGRVSDDVFARPSSTNSFEQGNWKPLTGGTRREHVSLAELFYGKGLLLACQLNVIHNLENPQAKSMFANIINYISDHKPGMLQNNVLVSGNLSSKQLSDLTGAVASVFLDASDSNHKIVLAFSGSNANKLKTLAEQGHTVMVLSPEVAGEFEGVVFEAEQNPAYLATKVGDHPLLQGISSANFLNPGLNAIKGYFSDFPANSRILLQGFASNSTFWTCADRGPVMLAIPWGDGEIILSTIEITMDASNMSREFLNLLLTNAGVSIPFVQSNEEAIAIKKTVPIKIDGILEEWLEELEDRLVTPYIHAQPIYLSSENIVEGPSVFDMNLSSIDYLMWNEKALFVAGVVFMENKLFGGESMGDNKAYVKTILLNDDKLTISLENNKPEVFLNDKKLDGSYIETGTINSKDMTDATKLQFNYIHASGRIVTIDQLIGNTFELMIPWELLKTNPGNKIIKALFSIESRGSKIQVPLNGNPSAKEDWMDMVITGVKR